MVSSLNKSISESTLTGVCYPSHYCTLMQTAFPCLDKLSNSLQNVHWLLTQYPLYFQYQKISLQVSLTERFLLASLTVGYFYPLILKFLIYAKVCIPHTPFQWQPLQHSCSGWDLSSLIQCTFFLNLISRGHAHYIFIFLQKYHFFFFLANAFLPFLTFAKCSMGSSVAVNVTTQSSGLLSVGELRNK